VLKQVSVHPALLEQWTLPTWSLGTTQTGRLNLYDGTLRAMDETGAIRIEFPASQYDKYIVESSLPWSYMKPVHLACDGEEHVYRVGPLPRLNVADATGTPAADQELHRLRADFGRPAQATVLQAYARAIELVYAAERGLEVLRDSRIGGDTRAAVAFRGGRGTAHVEAPRGSLFHDYEIDDQGIVRAANLVVATQQNYDAINRSIEQAARTHVVGKGDRALLNAVEFAIRCYDPCLSCATHAVGRMPLEVVVRRNGKVVRRFGRNADGEY
jgi:F420-non-reducing hydrogenase large subunit